MSWSAGMVRKERNYVVNLTTYLVSARKWFTVTLPGSFSSMERTFPDVTLTVQAGQHGPSGIWLLGALLGATAWLWSPGWDGELALTTTTQADPEATVRDAEGAQGPAHSTGGRQSLRWGRKKSRRWFRWRAVPRGSQEERAPAMPVSCSQPRGCLLLSCPAPATHTELDLPAQISLSWVAFSREHWLWPGINPTKDRDAPVNRGGPSTASAGGDPDTRGPQALRQVLQRTPGASTERLDSHKDHKIFCLVIFSLQEKKTLSEFPLWRRAKIGSDCPWRKRAGDQARRTSALCCSYVALQRSQGL